MIAMKSGVINGLTNNMAFQPGHKVNVGRKTTKRTKDKIRKKLKMKWEKIRVALKEYESNN